VVVFFTFWHFFLSKTDFFSLFGGSGFSLFDTFFDFFDTFDTKNHFFDPSQPKSWPIQRCVCMYIYIYKECQKPPPKFFWQGLKFWRFSSGFSDSGMPIHFSHFLRCRFLNATLFLPKKKTPHNSESREQVSLRHNSLSYAKCFLFFMPNFFSLFRGAALMPGFRHAHTLQQLQRSNWILTPGRVFKLHLK